MFTQHSAEGFRPLLPGIWIRNLVNGEKTLMAEFHLEKDCRLPRHSHPHEQTGYMVSGRMRFTVVDQVVEVGPGDSWCIPGGVEHEADILEDSLVVEIFSPVRDDYLPK